MPPYPSAESRAGSCPDCSREDVPSRADIEAIAGELELSLSERDPQTLAPRGERERRLSACGRCEHLQFGVLCAQCGCFVQIRALNAALRCPRPEGSLWA